MSETSRRFYLKTIKINHREVSLYTKNAFANDIAVYPYFREFLNHANRQHVVSSLLTSRLQTVWFFPD